MFFLLGLFRLHKGLFSLSNWLFLGFGFFKRILFNLVFPLLRQLLLFLHPPDIIEDTSDSVDTFLMNDCLHLIII